MFYTDHVKRLKRGFTLIELLVVIGILAVLLTIVLVAINPGRQFAQANNTKRRADINALLNAIHQYAADNKGAMPGNLGTLTKGTTYSITNGATNADLCTALMPTYLSSLPTDPSLNAQPITACTAYATGYQVIYGSATDATNRRVTVLAPTADLTVEPSGTTEISVTR